jgi:hypothetical protein
VTSGFAGLYQINVMVPPGIVPGSQVPVTISVAQEQQRQCLSGSEVSTPLLTIPNQLGVACNAHVMEAILTTGAPALGWR